MLVAQPMTCSRSAGVRCAAALALVVWLAMPAWGQSPQQPQAPPPAPPMMDTVLPVVERVMLAPATRFELAKLAVSVPLLDRPNEIPLLAAKFTVPVLCELALALMAAPPPPPPAAAWIVRLLPFCEKEMLLPATRPMVPLVMDENPAPNPLPLGIRASMWCPSNSMIAVLAPDRTVMPLEPDR